MTLMVNLEQIKRGKTCLPAFQELVKYFEENNITEISFDDVIAHWKRLNMRGWAIWAYQNKKVFEELASYTPTQDEVTQDVATLDSLETLTPIGYSVNGVGYATLEEAQAARNNQLAALKAEFKHLVVCNFEIFNQNGDATWVVVDLDTPNIPDGASIQVFNPVNGIYECCTTLEDALVKRDEFIVAAIDHMNGSATIFTVTQNLDFPDEQILTE